MHIALACIGALGGCAAVDARSAVTVRYVCAADVRFTATFARRAVEIATPAARYRLARRGGSLERYGSAQVAFVRDGPAAVLIGADGGPFDDCAVAR